MGDTFAAKRLLYRRLRCLANYESANRNLEKSRAKNRDVQHVSIILIPRGMLQAWFFIVKCTF